jgi:hypothetical protein
MEVNAYMIVRNNLLMETWLEHFIGRLIDIWKMEKHLQTNLLLTYDLGCSIKFWQFAPNTIYDVVIF